MSLTEKDYLKKLDIRVLILSRSRFDTIAKNTAKILPSYIEVLVPESEKELYAEKITNPLLTVPDEIKGLGMLRNWILDNFKEETIVMIDDDIQRFVALTDDYTVNIKDPEQVLQIIINTAVMTKDAELHCFGFSQTDIRKFNGTEPFKLNGWVGCIVGVVGRKYKFRNDKYKVDIDFCLQNLLVERKLFIDNRYYCNQNRDNNTGGNAKFRTQDEFNASVESLQKKWGKFINVKDDHKSQIKISLKVKRKQDLKHV